MVSSWHPAKQNSTWWTLFIIRGWYTASELWRLVFEVQKFSLFQRCGMDSGRSSQWKLVHLNEVLMHKDGGALSWATFWSQLKTLSFSWGTVRDSLMAWLPGLQTGRGEPMSVISDTDVRGDLILSFLLAFILALSNVRGLSLVQQLKGDGTCGWEEDAGEWIGGGGIDVSQCWGRGTTPETTSLNPGEIEGGNWSWWDTLARPSPEGGNLSEVQETDRKRSEGSLSDTLRSCSLLWSWPPLPQTQPGFLGTMPLAGTGGGGDLNWWGLKASAGCEGGGGTLVTGG